MSENEKIITEGLEKNIKVVDAPKEVKKTDKVSRIIKLASTTFKKTTRWFKKQLNKVNFLYKQKQMENIENKLSTREFQKINDKSGRKHAEKYIYKKALKYEKLKDQLGLLITAGTTRIPEKIDIPVEKRAINIKNAMFKALIYNGSGWVLDPEKYDDVFSANNQEVNENINEDTINFDNIDKELKKFQDQESKTDTNIDMPQQTVSNTYINPEEVLAITQKGLYGHTKDNIIQDLPINSVEEQDFDAVGMTEEEIAESMQKIGEYKAMINSNDEEQENSFVENDKISQENNVVENDNENIENKTTEIRENGTKVEVSSDGKSKMFDFTNTDRTYMDGTTKVTISNQGKSKVYEFNTNNNEKEESSLNGSETVNKDITKIDLNINELKDYRSQLAQLSEQRKVAEAAKQRAAEERIAAEKAVQDARMKAQQAKENYIEKINREKAEIDAINSDISNMTSDIQKNQQAAKMANEYAEAIEQMISGENDVSEEKGNTK